MIDLSYTDKDGFTPVDGTTNLDYLSMLKGYEMASDL